MKIKATAKVKILLEVELGQPWGDDCQLQQVFSQAADSAAARVRCLIQSSTDVRILGEPQVFAVIIPE